MNSQDSKVIDQFSAILLSKNLKFVLLFFLSLFVTYIAFSPAIHFDFAHHDQYRYFYQDKSLASHDQQFIWLIKIGRPIAALIEQVIFQQTFFLEDLKIFRIFCCIIISILMLASTYWFRKCRFTIPEAFFISCAIFTLPAIQNFVVMTNLANLLAIGLAFASYFFYNRHFRSLGNSASLQRFSPSIFASSFLFLGSLLTYPTLAYSFLLPFFANLLFQKSLDKEKIKQLVVRPFLFVGIHSVLYYIIVRFCIQKIWHYSSKAPKIYKFAVSGCWSNKISYFFSEIFPAASNFWNIYPSQLIAWGVVLSIVICCTYKYREIKSDCCSFRYFIFFLLFLISFLLLSCYIYFLKTDFGLLYRLLFVFSVMLFLVVVYDCKEIFSSSKKVRFALLGGISVLAIILANQNVFKTALNAHMEITYIASQIRSSPNKTYSRVHFIVPKYTEGFTGNVIRTDEFNCPSTFWFQDIPFITKCVLNSLNDRKKVVVTSSYEGDPCTVDKTTLIINMKGLNGCHK